MNEGCETDLEVRPDRTGLIDDVVEGPNVELVDETIDRVDTVASGDANEHDVRAIQVLDLCDRRGFTLASRSPRCPEPQQHVLPA